MTFGIIALAVAWQFISPEAPQIVAMEWKRVLGSSSSASLRREIPPAAVPVLSNINFIEGIERVVWTPGLAILEGSFDLQKIKEMASADGGVTKPYKKVELLAPAENDGTHVGLISPSLLMLGTETEIKSAVDRSEKAKDWGTGGYDLWIRTSGSRFSRHEFGIRLIDQAVQVSSKIRYPSEISARTAAENALLLGLIGRQSGQEASLTGSFSPEQFAKREWRTAIENMYSSSIVESESEPRKPGVIRIYGLDEGVREIPLK